MSIGAIPASEIVRAAEAAVRRAFELRAEADAIEAEARSRAVEALGNDLGAAAMDMARLTASTRAAGQQGDAGQTKGPAIQPEAVSEAAAEPSMPLAGSDGTAAVHRQAAVPERGDSPTAASTDSPDLCGVDVPPSRMQEAEEIVSQAESLFQQGRKSNPYASDRGKNAWRKALFRAAWEKLATAGEAEAAPTAAGKPAVSVTAAPHPSSTPLRAPVAGDMEDLDAEEDVPDTAKSSAKAVGYEDLDEDDGEAGHEAAGVDAGPSAEPAWIDDVPDEANGKSIHVPNAQSASEARDETPASPEPEDDYPELVAADADTGPDPLDDLDESEDLPPPAALPPPRGYATHSTHPVAAPSPVHAVRVEAAVQPPVTEAVRPSPPAAVPPPRPAPPPTAPPPKPSAPAAPSPRPPAAAPRQEPPKPAYPLHTPIPVPPTRRPGNGQVLQRPSPPRDPSASSQPARPAPAPARFAPPSFTR